MPKAHIHTHSWHGRLVELNGLRIHSGGQINRLSSKRNTYKLYIYPNI